MPERRATPPGRRATWPALAALALWAGAAAAEDRRAAALDSCLAASEARAEDSACRDIVYAQCLARGDDTTAGMAGCLAEEQALWDARLTALWPQVSALAEAQRDPAQAPQQALAEAQRSWIAHRDAECTWTLRRQQGSIRLILVAACMRDMTAERVADFRDWLRDAAPR